MHSGSRPSLVESDTPDTPDAACGAVSVFRGGSSGLYRAASINGRLRSCVAAPSEQCRYLIRDSEGNLMIPCEAELLNDSASQGVTRRIVGNCHLRSRQFRDCGHLTLRGQGYLDVVQLLTRLDVNLPEYADRWSSFHLAFTTASK